MKLVFISILLSLVGTIGSAKCMPPGGSDPNVRVRDVRETSPQTRTSQNNAGDFIAGLVIGGIVGSASVSNEATRSAAGRAIFDPKIISIANAGGSPNAKSNLPNYVLFLFNSGKATTESASFEPLAKALRSRAPRIKYAFVRSITDSSGSVADNRRIAVERSRFVVSKMRGIARHDFEICEEILGEAWGELERFYRVLPVSRQRRVEVYLYY